MNCENNNQISSEETYDSKHELQESKELNNPNIYKMSIVEQQLKAQLEAGYLLQEVGLDGESNYDLTSKDFEAVSIISQDILEKNGYEFYDIREKVLSIFNIESNNNHKTILVEGFCRNEPLYQLDFEGVLSSNLPIQINFKNNFLIETLFIPELIDYHKAFPEIALLESSLKTEFNNYKLILWKDAPALAERRNFNAQLLVNRNLYLFNDDKSKLPWLLKNDELFMKSLVLTFGWEGDDKLLKWVIKETPLNFNREFNNAKDFGRLLYNKDCSGNLKINKRVFELMAEENINNHRKYLMDFIYLYLASNLYQDDIELTFPELAKITAYSLNFISNNLEKEQDIYNYQGLFAEKSDYDNRYDKEFKKNNFYGIPGFKEKWEEAKIEGDGIALPGEE